MDWGACGYKVAIGDAPGRGVALVNYLAFVRLPGLCQVSLAYGVVSQGGSSPVCKLAGATS